MPRPSSRDVLDIFWQHEVTVERLAGSNAYGDTYDDPETLLGFVEDSNKLIVNGAGEQVVSSARVFLPKGTAAVPLGSRVTLGGPFLDRTTEVIAVSVHDGGGLPTPDHLELGLR